jgi:tetratricopeptide (TPR) repeat protein
VAVKKVALAVLLLAGLTIAYGYTVTRRERLYRQLVVQGDLALARGDTFSAVSSFGDAIALKPESMLGYLKRGDAHRLRGDLEAAAGDLETARRLDPAAPRAVELLGDVAAARQLPDEAAGYYRACVHLDDRSPRVLYKLGLALQSDGRCDEAIGTLEQAVALDARFAEAHYLLGVCRRELKQIPAATLSFEKAAALSPTLLQAREQLAELYGASGRRAERLRQLEGLLAAAPAPSRQVALALAYADSGQLSRAVRLLGNNAELYPDHAGTYVALGQVWLRAAGTGGDRLALAKAIEALRHATSMEASSAALALLGQARLLAADPAAAERTLRQATETFPTEPAAFLHLADAADRTGHHTVARRALLDYQTLTGAADTPLLMRIAQAHWRSGDLASARRMVARVLARDPENQTARDLERRMD